MKKYYHPQDKEKKAGRWSYGFTNSKGGKSDKKNKPKKSDSVEFEDGTVLLIDEPAEVTSLTGKVTLFAIGKGSLKVGGKKVV